MVPFEREGEYHVLQPQSQPPRGEFRATSFEYDPMLPFSRVTERGESLRKTKKGQVSNSLQFALFGNFLERFDGCRRRLVEFSDCAGEPSNIGCFFDPRGLLFIGPEVANEGGAIDGVKKQPH